MRTFPALFGADGNKKRKVTASVCIRNLPPRLPIKMRSAQACAPSQPVKASQSFAAAAAKEGPIIFSGDMCVGENTSQAASVEFVCRRRTNYARSRLQPLCQKGILFDRCKCGAHKRALRMKTGVIYLIVSSSSPALTDWPPLTKTSSIVPSMRATTLVSIFMASITASTSLTLT